LKLELDKASKTIHILLVYIFAVIPNNIRWMFSNAFIVKNV
jgi:hypothetical protein